jgi:hypothetical protein
MLWYTSPGNQATISIPAASRIAEKNNPGRYRNTLKNHRVIARYTPYEEIRQSANFLTGFPEEKR